MTSVTIKLFLPNGDAKGLRTAEVRGGGSNGLTEWKAEDGTTLKELDERI